MDEEMYFQSEDREAIPKSVRHRKKQLYSAIRERMEFYFSDANIQKDRFLKQLIDTDPKVDLSIFLRFNRIQQLTTNITDIAKALKKSELLQLTEDKTKVFRTTPVKEKDNVDACTIYVEQLTVDTDHDWVKKIFSKYGQVDYVSIPKYKHSGKVKGFAFVEFALPEQAKTALAAFEKEGCCLTNNMDPQELCSIVTHEEPSAAAPAPEEIGADSEKPPDSDKSKNSKKRKLFEKEAERDSSEGAGGKKSKTETETQESATEEKVEEDQKENEKEEEGSDSAIKKKKKKNRKKKKSQKEKYPNDIKSYGLHVLSKTDWKRLRNKYLDLQKARMKRLKQNLYRSQGSHATPSYGTPSGHSVPAALAAVARPKYTFQPGVILKITLAEALAEDTQVAQFKADAKALEGVVYVDAAAAQDQVHVRVATPEVAQELVTHKTVQAWGKSTVLQGDEEAAYWDKMAKNRKEKLENGSKFKKRGRDKLLSKAQRLVSKRIRLSVDD